MKKNKWLIIGVVGVIAYYLYKKKKGSAGASENLAESSVEEVVEEVAGASEDGLMG